MHDALDGKERHQGHRRGHDDRVYLAEVEEFAARPKGRPQANPVATNIRSSMTTRVASNVLETGEASTATARTDIMDERERERHDGKLRERDGGNDPPPGAFARALFGGAPFRAGAGPARAHSSSGPADTPRRRPQGEAPRYRHDAGQRRPRPPPGPTRARR